MNNLYDGTLIQEIASHQSHIPQKFSQLTDDPIKNKKDVFFYIIPFPLI